MTRKGVRSTQRIERLQKVARLDRQGYNQYEIAHKLGVSQAQIHRDLRVIQSQYLKDAVKDRSLLIAKMERQYDDMLVECWKAYRRSKQDMTKVVEKVQPVMHKDSNGTPTGDVTMEVVEVATTREGRLPGAEYLAMIERILKAKRDLYGLDAPKRVEMKRLTIDFEQLMNEINKGDNSKLPQVEEQLQQMIEQIPQLPNQQAQTSKSTNGHLPNGLHELPG